MASEMQSKSKKKVLVALSGGVDSAVTAKLLIDQGYSVEGAHMVCWNEGPYCRSDQDRADAAKVAAFLNLPFQVFDFRKEYKEDVINYFYSEYEAGRTPNPDVACNSAIKFGIFLKKALEAGYDYIATGHYARVESESGQFTLKAGLDPEKDQTYFLYRLTQNELSHVLFPIGNLKKTEVRKLAEGFGLPNAAKKDSQGICFVGDVDVREFLRERIADKPGAIVNTKGEKVGEHRGLAFYTIGQREGVGVSNSVPYYVIGKDKATNTLIVGPLGDPNHFKKEMWVESASWVNVAPEAGTEVSVRIRYRQTLVSATIKEFSGKGLLIEFDEEQRAITPGQAVVIYQDDNVLGGATISEFKYGFVKTLREKDALVSI